MITQAFVDELLGNARNNGEHFAAWSAETIARDLYDCAAIDDDVTVEELLPLIKNWLARRTAVG